jgi:hypothetical protein
MRKTVVLELDELLGGSRHGNELRELVESFQGDRKDSPYNLSSIGVLYEGKGGHTEVKFHQQDLFLRFSKASLAAQKLFIESAYDWTSRRERGPVLIEVHWSAAGKVRNIEAKFESPSGVGGALHLTLV